MATKICLEWNLKDFINNTGHILAENWPHINRLCVNVQEINMHIILLLKILLQRDKNSKILLILRYLSMSKKLVLENIGSGVAGY